MQGFMIIHSQGNSVSGNRNSFVLRKCGKGNLHFFVISRAKLALGSVQVLYKHVWGGGQGYDQKCLYCVCNISISGGVQNLGKPAYIILARSLTYRQFIEENYA